MPNIKPSLFLIVLLLTSCDPSGQENSDFCAKADPIYVGSSDVISGTTARQIDAYDDYGQKKCGWRPAQ